MGVSEAWHFFAIMTGWVQYERYENGYQMPNCERHSNLTKIMEKARPTI